MPDKLSAEALEAMGKKELIEELHKISPLSFLQEYKLAGSVANVAKKAKKEDCIKAYEDLFAKGVFATQEQRDAEQLAYDLEKKAKLEEEKKASDAKKAEAGAGETHDGGDEVKRFTKVTNKNGNKQNYPKKGDKVKCYYTGRLEDGTIFDSNCDEAWLKAHKRKNQPLTFKVGSGLVIKGWDQALLEMSVGEKATVTIEPEWAYGKKGMPEVGIGPNATLIFDITLEALV